jgi:protein-S-isoprenylcysteine O-methyltransferase Ste14
MILTLFVILVAAAAAYLTSLACRFVQSRHHKAGWYLGVLGAIAASVLTVLCIYQGDVFHPSKWDIERIMIPMIFVISSGIGLVPALFMVWYYRKRFRDVDHVT